MKEIGFTLVIARNRRCPIRTIADVDYTDDIALLANTPTHAPSLQHTLEQAAGGIDLYVNADKTEFMGFNQRGDIFTLNDRSLKLVDKFTYPGSSVSSTENNINTRLSVTWELDLSNKIKHIFPSCSRVNTAVWMHHKDAD